MSDEHRDLFGKIALENGLITREQLDKCLGLQRAGNSTSTIGQILLEQGFLDRNKLRFIEEKQVEKLKKTAVSKKKPTKDFLFGNLLVKRGYCEEQQMLQVLLEKARRESEGQKVSFGDLLLEGGILSPYQLKMFTLDENKKIVQCSTCKKFFKIVGFKDGWRMRCPACDTALVTPRRKADVKKPEEIYFDDDRAENLGLFAKVAVQNGYLTIEQVEEAVNQQASSEPAKSLDEILIEKGWIDKAKMEDLRKRVQFAVKERESFTARRLRQVQFGQVSIKEGFASEEMVNRALLAQEENAARGKPHRRIGTILVEQLFLTNQQVARILKRQGKRIALCGECRNQFNLIHFNGQDAQCPDCKKPMLLPDFFESVAVKEDVLLAEENLAVIDLGTQDQAQDAGLQSTRRMFRQFYEKEKIKDDAEAAAEAPEEPEDKEGKTGQPAVKARGAVRGAARVDDFRKIRPSVVKRSSIPWIMAGTALLLAAVAVGGYFVSKMLKPLPPPPLIEDINPWLKLTEGSFVQVYGAIPPGNPGQISVRSETHQAFLVRVKPGEEYWAYDPAGASSDQLEFLVREREENPEVEKFVFVRGKYSTKPPAGIAVPAGAAKGYVLIEQWRSLPPDLFPKEENDRLIVEPPPPDEDKEKVDESATGTGG